MNIRNNIIIENKSAQGFAILCVFAIPWIYAPAASKLGLRPSDSLAAAAHFISWNDTNAHNVLLNPCTLFVFNNLFSLQKPRLPYGDRGFGLPEAAGSPLSHSS